MRPTLLGLTTLLTCAVAGCGSPNAGYAAASEFEAWLAENPVEGYAATEVSGNNLLPFSGELDVTMAALDPASLGDSDYELAMSHVASAVCEFEPEADVSIDWAFAVGSYSVPMECPGAPDGGERLADAAGLLSELMTVPGVESITYVATSLVAQAKPGADLETVRVAVERVALRHTLALGDDSPYVSVQPPRKPEVPRTPGPDRSESPKVGSTEPPPATA